MEKMKRLRHATSGLCTVAGLKIKADSHGKGGGQEGRACEWEVEGGRNKKTFSFSPISVSKLVVNN
jgi:hypothetical protein